MAFEPYTLADEFGTVTLAGIYTYGESVHTFVERTNYTGPFMPGFVAKTSIGIFFSFTKRNSLTT